MREVNRQVIREFRENHGEIKTGRFAGSHLLLLTTVGAKSGQPRTSPLMYLTIDDRLVIFASKNGAPTNPDWYHNLLATPRVTAELPDGTFETEAAVLEGADREQTYAKALELFPGLAGIQAKTARQIPVVALSRPA
ncbi:MAG TPA: nitroreductase/quinone reductase family protein [Chloroflexota bacterium]|nr:nitroreductase/quinone reductase family protein [Chloroflexota bacterium]